MSKSFTFYRQFDQKDCGPTCLRMILKYYGKNVSAEFLNERAHISRSGVSMAGIMEAAENMNLQCAVVSIPFKVLQEDVTYPCIAYWRNKHFVVIYKIDKKYVYVADPAFGKIKYTKIEFCKGWYKTKEIGEGIVMLLEPSTKFYTNTEQKENKSKGLYFLKPYLLKHKKSWIQLLFAVLSVSIIQIAFPFLTQSIVDVGIANNNLSFIYLILIAQLVLIFSQTAIQIIRDWLLLYTTNKININLISDYLIKLMKLPLNYYDTKNDGDIMQRIQDNARVQNFLSTTTLNVIFSTFTFVIFGGILLYYSYIIFLVFFIGSSIYFAWYLLFLKRRAELDYKRFDQASGNQTSLIQLINGMPEIRINGSERKRRWEWEAIQIKLYKISMKGLALSQTQNSGGIFINETKNAIITVLSATLVIEGQLTLGMMVSIQYIIGQLNLPVSSFVTFIQSAQDAKLSIKRLEEVYKIKDEEFGNYIEPPHKADIIIKNLNFRYGGKKSPKILNQVSLIIPRGKITAVVGVSGSGKTTLMKLLLKFYKVKENKIFLNTKDFTQMSPKLWRKNCGVVMQEGYIFSGSIEANISESEDFSLISKEKLIRAAKMANIHEFIESLPNKYNTGIGKSGMGLSGGQKQRILIARAVYKEPDYLFFDEATSALDAYNEKVIMENMQEFFAGKTVFIIAHRLSTVKNSDKIIVLDKGIIVEQGNHNELVQLKGKYFNLIKNQLELGN